jgi:hypothetical protein
VKHNVLLALAILMIVRVLLQLALYAAGFEALTADDFGRVVVAGLWMRSPHAIWQGAWLPFHTYVIGAALYLWNDLLLVPRLITFGFGVASLVCMYNLTYALFNDRRIGFMSAVLLAVNPAHIWLSSAPLTEIMQSAFIIGFLWANVQLILRKQIHYLYISAALLSIDNTVRFEGWIFSCFFTAQLLFFSTQASWRNQVRFYNIGIAVAILWIFPIAWIAGNYIRTGDPLFFMTVNRDFDKKWYGNYSSYANYGRTFFGIDPYATLLIIPAGVLYFIYQRRKHAVHWTFALIFACFIVFMILQRGQIQPSGNYIRYLSLFLFISYPFVAWLIDALAGYIFSNRTLKVVVVILALSLIGILQVRSAFQFVNDPAAEGLGVGQQIRALRLQNPSLSSKPILIELNYWQYLAIHVGANDLSSLVYDRALNFSKLNDSPSRIQASPLILPACIQFYHISYVVVRSAELRQIVQAYLKARPAAEYHGYAVYRVADTGGSDQEDHNPTCPLKVGTGY